MTTISISDCKTFLDVDDMKFIALDLGNECDDCYFHQQLNGGRPTCELINSASTHCIDDNRNIIWMRIE